jgi:hypothetical protein
MSLGSTLLMALILMLVGVLPTWPRSVNWGYLPSGGLGIALIILVMLIFTGPI